LYQNNRPVSCGRKAYKKKKQAGSLAEVVIYNEVRIMYKKTPFEKERNLIKTR